MKVHSYCLNCLEIFSKVISRRIGRQLPLTKCSLNVIEEDLFHDLKIVLLAESKHGHTDEHDQDYCPDSQELNQVCKHLLKNFEHGSKGKRGSEV